MANQKISDLTSQPTLSAIDGLAGYEGASNVRISGQNIIDAIPTLYSSNGTIGTNRVATITDFPKFSGDQGNPIGLEIENSRAGTSQSTHGAQLKLTARAGASSTISFYNGLGGGTSAPAMVIDSPAGIRYTGGSTYVGYHHSFNRGGTTPWYIGMSNSPLGANSPKLEMLLGGGGSNASFYTTKINGSNDFLYMFMSPGTAARHIALGEYTNSTNTYKDFLRINGIGDIGINQDTPTAKLHIKGSGSSSSSTSLLVENFNGDDILNIKDDGAFALGKGATPSISQSVVIGDTATANQRGISIGYSTTSGDSGVTIGWDAGVNFSTGRNINIGHMAQGSGFNSILLSAAAGNGATTNTDNYNFSVYMTSKATPDFKVVGGGESVLNTSLQVTGQAYSTYNEGAGIDSIDFNDGNVQEVTLVTAVETDFDPSNFKAGSTYILELVQPTGGSALVGWEAAGATVKWPGGTAPTLSTAAGAVDIVTLVCTSETGQGTFYAVAQLDFS